MKWFWAVFRIQVLNNWSTIRPGVRTSITRGEKKYKGIWLVIDEFNRADIDKALGQLFTALETRILKVPVMNSKTGYEERKIPLDYRIIGTLNTADKHYLFKLSDALKRRFAYVEISPPGKGPKRYRDILCAKKCTCRVRYELFRWFTDS